MAKKIQLQDANGNVLHPLTLGECVTMSNGENLDTLMSKSQMFTPTIAQDKSMFKVGTGVDVDYSANVKDGAYESLVFKGKSLVNLLTSLRPDTDSAWVRNGSSFTLNASGVLFLNYAALLKPNTTYTVVGELDFDVDGIVIGFREGDKSWEVNRSIGSRGRFAVLISTSAESTSNALTAHRAVTSNSDRVTLSNLMVLEGDWTNAELPPYFEGLGSCKMPILRNVGKNLFDINGEIIPYTTNTYNISNGTLRVKGEWYVRQILPLKPNTEYTVKMNVKGISGTTVKWNIYYNRTSQWVTGGGGDAITFTTPKDFNDISILFYSGAGEVGEAEFSNIQVEESPTATTYEDHKTNILRTSEEVILRSVGDTKDSYNALTGEYVQRIVEYVFNGSESEAWNFAEMKGDNYRFGINLPIFGNKSADKTALICDRLKVGDVAQEPKQEQITTYNHDSHFELRIALSPSTLASNNVGELRRYLQANPITIQYAVAEPTTAIIKPSTIPFAYANGHMVLESGSSGQSLSPHLKYSVVTGRTGQVTQNTKVLRKQEQQIIGLEELLLTQVVQMEYERTLLQFDYELQMMMLG
jgi:hypothetical protein